MSHRPRPSAALDLRSPRAIAAEFRKLLKDGVPLRVAGEAKNDPEEILRQGYRPRYKVELFDTVFYLSEVRQNPAIRFFVAYLHQGKQIHARIFYKDVSLIWRVASHMIASDKEFWIGKGDVRIMPDGEHETVESLEATTDLPYELQDALEILNHPPRKVRNDEESLFLVLRNAPDGRVEPYADFTRPRLDARKRGDTIHGGKSIARFTRRHDPTSLTFVKGFEPDLNNGVFEVRHGRSKLYGGRLRMYRVLSTNRLIQYLFFVAPQHVWIVPPQTLSRELSSYGVRVVDVEADEDLFVPGFEYHYTNDDDSEFSQIPPGFVGPSHPDDPDRSDASPWLEKLPIVQDFRTRVLAQAGR